MRPASASGFTYQAYELIRDHRADRVPAATPEPLNVAVDGPIEPTLLGQLVTGGYFPFLGVRPAVGRLLGPDDDRVPTAIPSRPQPLPSNAASAAVRPHRHARSRSAACRSPSSAWRPPEFFGAEVGAAPELFAPVHDATDRMPMTVNLLARSTERRVEMGARPRGG